MSQSQTSICRRCTAPLSAKDLIGDTVVCSSCGSFYKISPARSIVRKIWITGIIASVVLGAVIIGTRSIGRITAPTKSSTADRDRMAGVKDLTGIDAEVQGCLRAADDGCLKAAYERALELAPREVRYRANLAMTLTRLKEHDRALPLYGDLIDEGVGTYDLMAYYAESLYAKEQFAQSETWLINALSLKPNLVDTAERLAQVLVRLHRPLEAASLLESFISKYPEARSVLAGNLVSTRAHVTVEEAERVRIRLLALPGAHHFLPISLVKSEAPVMFLVDTGATAVTMNESDFRRAYPKLANAGRMVQLGLADGRVIVGRKVTVPELHIGAWTERNVEVVYCETCVNLAGNSLLSRFRMKMSTQVAMSTLVLSR